MNKYSSFKRISRFYIYSKGLGFLHLVYFALCLKIFQKAKTALNPFFFYILFHLGAEQIEWNIESALSLKVVDFIY